MSTAYSMSTEQRGDGTFRLRILSIDVEQPGSFESVEYPFDYAAGWSLVQNLLVQLNRAADERMRNAAVGDCATCGNRRMVEVQKYGRPWSENCPDCRERWDNASPAYPSFPA